MTDIFQEIATLKQRENATILAHYYQEGEIQELADYTGWRTRQQARRIGGDAKLLGIGLTTFIETSGGSFGNNPGIPQEAATVRIRRELVIFGVHGGQRRRRSFTPVADAVVGGKCSQPPGFLECNLRRENGARIAHRQEDFCAGESSVTTKCEMWKVRDLPEWMAGLGSRGDLYFGHLVHR